MTCLFTCIGPVCLPLEFRDGGFCCPNRLVRHLTEAFSRPGGIIAVDRLAFS